MNKMTAGEQIEMATESLEKAVFEVRCAHNRIMQDLRHLLEPIQDHDIERLREHVTRLKQSDGEGWAIGEMLERAICLIT